MVGIEHLREAGEELRRSDRDARDRLRGAAQRFWRAVYEFESWPPPVQDRATAVLRRLFRDGVIEETVRKASGETVETLSYEIRSFCEEAEGYAGPHSPDRLEWSACDTVVPFRRRAFGDFL